MGFSCSIPQAVRPHIIKLYAANLIPEMEVVAANALKYSIILFSMMAIPVMIEADYIFSLWLVEVPPYAVGFCQLVLISCVFNMTNGISGMMVHATGKIKGISLYSGTLYWLMLSFCYLAFKLGMDVTWAYYIDIVGMIFINISNVMIAKYNIPQLRIGIIYKQFFVALSAVIPIALLTAHVVFLLPESLGRVVLTALLYISVMSVFVYLFIIDEKIREKVNATVLRLIRRR